MRDDIVFEEALSDEWSKDLGVVEVPLPEHPIALLGALAALLGLVFVVRIFFLGVSEGAFYVRRAEANRSREMLVPAPRGVIYDRHGTVIAESIPVFSAYLNVRDFLHLPELQEETLRAIFDSLQISRDEVWALVGERDLERSADPIVLTSELTQQQLVALEAFPHPTIFVAPNYRRVYPDGPVFSSVLGYLGLPSSEDLDRDSTIFGQDFIGKSGIEAHYDSYLRGEHGITLTVRDAEGTILDAQRKSDPEIGRPLTLTIDADFQRAFYRRFEDALRALGRTSGAAIALDPHSGEVLALMSFPSFDGNVFNGSGRNEEKADILLSPNKPLFNRPVSGLYAPGSTIKPLHALAAFEEGVISPTRTIFSPGYLDVPNPYVPDRPTRFVDWRYQGDVDLSSALAQSSNVYFYVVGGGFGDITGLGISRLRAWWQKFKLDAVTGIDLPGEAGGFLPSAEWKEERTERPWLLGDTYNVSIGQGDLQVTPLSLLSYIAGIANGGVLYQPVLSSSATHPVVRADLSEYREGIAEVQKGMREAVTSPLGTASLLATLPMSASGKTGSAQVFNKSQENAFFVGYAPAEDPKIAVLVLVENSKEGSLNAVPIARDALAWYYENRLRVDE